MKLYSYVVRYDSGFAPNPFYGWCTLATCKPKIRKAAAAGDLIVGTGSAARDVRRGNCLVYWMRVTEVLDFDSYASDPRFSSKKPYRRGSKKQSCGDNIYFRDSPSDPWQQRDSFHSNLDGTQRPDHTERDTGVDRVLASDDFAYFGGTGPMVPEDLARDGRSLSKTGIGYHTFDDETFIQDVLAWLLESDLTGFQGAPFDWVSTRA